jgi:Bacterial pre-peptidase C-terminal domain
MIRANLFAAGCTWIIMVQAVGAQPKPDPKTAPQILVMVPLGVPVGMTSRVTLRGLRLDTAGEVRFKETGITVKILNKTKVGVPNPQDASKLGDSQVEVELKIPADFKGNTAQCLVKTPQGESAGHQLLVDAQLVLHEKEPNNGFRQAQPIIVPSVIEGRISSPLDVDVFRIDAKAGQQLTVEIHAARHGSPLDSILTLYDSTGQIVASNDDFDGSPDSRIEVRLPKSGSYFISVLDAHDQGGPTHVYRLNVRLK